MLHNLLTADFKQPIPLTDAALFALLGFLTVFAGIIILILIVWLVGKIMSANKAQPKAKKEKVVEKSTPSVAPTAQAQPTAFEDVDEETVAVIMATLTAYYQTNYPKYEFTVKRIKRF